MEPFKRRKIILFSLIIFLLTGALLVSLHFTVANYNRCEDAKERLEENRVQLTKQQQKIDDLLSQIAAYAADGDANREDLDELLSALNVALEEKTKLEQENQNLKAEIEELKVLKKRQELQQAIALKNVNQATAGESNICYLTFDDGPSDSTLQILDILDSYGIKATFFVVGNAKIQYLPQIVSRGHAIGLHSTTHDYSRIYADVNSYLADIQQVSNIVFDITGIRCNMMRFPGGSSNKVSKEYCTGIMSDITVRMESLGYSYFDWNVSSGDSAGNQVPAEKIINNVLSGAQNKKSVCVLMHDLPVSSTTVEALPYIIEGLDAMGFRFATLTAETYGFHQAVQN